VNAIGRWLSGIEPASALCSMRHSGHRCEIGAIFPLHTTRQDTDSALCSSSAMALLPEIEPSEHVIAGYLHHFETQQTPFEHR
jgi:hypothetical protein